MAAGALHHINRVLLNMTQAASTAQTGGTYRVLFDQNDQVENPQQGFRVYFRNVQAGGATSPTSQVRLQTSYDGTHWFDVASSTQLTADSNKAELVDITAMGSYVRAVTVVGGASAPNHTATCHLVSNARFTLKAIA